jgi:PAS domain S-box-containing protein
MHTTSILRQSVCSTNVDFPRIIKQLNGLNFALIDPNHPSKPIVHSSDEFCHLFHYAQADINGKPLSLLAGVETNRCNLDRLEDALGRSACCAEELLLYTANGTPVWCLVTVAPVCDDAGQITYFFANVVDVSQRKMTEQDRIHTERLKALGTLAASIGHEFNNIIQVVSHAAYAAEKEAVSQKQRRNLERVVWGFEQASVLATQMLSLARKQAPKTAIVDLNQVIKGFDRMISQTVKKGVNIRFALSNSPLMIEVDTAQLELALLNLVKNSSDAIEGKGVIVVRTQLVDGIREDSMFVELTVTDNGRGMDRFTADHALDPFFTTKDGRGTGLGLPMVNGFMVQSGGWLYLETREGRGTTVRLRFNEAIAADDVH